MDPTGTGIGKAAGELLKEMQKAQNELQQIDRARPSGDASQFENVMQSQQAKGMHAAKHVHGAQNAAKVLYQAKIDQLSPSTRVGAAAAAKRSRMANMLEGLINGQDKMARIMNLALSGRQFSPQELLAMQASVYRYAQELELTSKVVEKATSGIKQTMNTQV